MKLVATVSLILIFFGMKAQDQSFKAAASVPAVEEEGFYQLLISPEINIYLNNDFSDIRIYDPYKDEVPFIFQKGARRFNNFKILIKKFEPGCCTLLMLHNSDKVATDNIRLAIRNEVTAKQATLLGSNDRQNWLTLKDWFKLPVISNGGFAEIEINGFPNCNYEFFFLRFNDPPSAPLNIVDAGYNITDPKLDLTEIPLKIVASEHAEEKKTYVRLLFDTLQFVDRVEIAVGGVKFFRRRAILSEKRVRKSKNGKTSEYYSSIQHFDLTSGQAAKLNLTDIRTKELLLVIENEDNPPLSISAIKTFQLNRYLIAWLNPVDEYTLKFGDENIAPPVYDLSFFQDSIPKQLKVLKATDIYSLDDGFGGPSNTFFTNKMIIWIAIIAVIVLLAFMSKKIIRESAKGDGKIKE